MIIHSHKAIHIHISKCAGQSIERSLGQYIGQHHLRPAIIKAIGKARWDSYYKFSFVRNPWDRLVSLYHFRLKKMRHLIKGRSFDTWLRQVFDEYHPKVHQHYWIAEDGVPFVDFIGKFENLSEDFSRVCSRIGAAVPLLHINKSSHKHYAEYYNAESRDFVQKACAADIDMFGYTFDGKFAPAMVLR